MRGIDSLLEHIAFLARNIKGVDEEYIIGICLIEIGVPTHIDGFDHLVEAIMIWRSKPDVKITKDIYPELSRRRGIYCRPVRVEGTIRHAIKMAWKTRDDIWYSYFPKERKKPPSNSEFVSRMAKVVDMWESYCETISDREGGWVR